MNRIGVSRTLINRSFALAVVVWITVALATSSCNAPATLESTSSTSGSTSQLFAGGTKAVKVVTSKSTLAGSFTLPGVVPTVTPIPTAYPGYDGSTAYNPGISASRFYDVDGTSAISKPSWLTDVQVGVTSISASSACAKFGDGATSLDVQDYFRTSERDCAAVSDGSGAGTDPVFVRIVLNRDNAYIGSAENLLIQVEYQASGLHLNSDGASFDVEDNLDQLWKVFWNSTLGTGSAPKPFSVFVPPNYAACLQSGTLAAGAPGNCSSASYRGAPVRVKQIIVPLAAYPTMSVIQLTRVKSRITAGAPYNYVNSYCTTSDSPLCLGVVIRSVTLMRI